jgi:hypothetical protein
MAGRPDPLKVAVAEGVQRGMVALAAEALRTQFGGIDVPYTIEAVETTATDWLTTTLWVQTSRGAIRRFEVQVRERER